MIRNRLHAWMGIMHRKGLSRGLGTLLNSLAAKAHAALGRQEHFLPFFPTNLIVGVVNACNLHCVACMAHGYPEARVLAARDPNKFMRLEQFSRILDQGAKLAHTLDLTSPGEAFLNPQLYDMISLVAQDCGIYVKLDTNGHVMDAEAVVDSGLSQITFAVDGFSQTSYETYRRGGKLATVVANVERLSEATLRKGSTLDIRVKYLVHAFTEGEVEQARKYFSQFSNVSFFVEVFFPPAPSLEFCQAHPFETTPELFQHWKASKECYNLYYFDETTGRCRHKCMTMPLLDICRNPFQGLSIMPDGEAYACCFATGFKTKELYMGNVYEEGLSSVFNGPRANAMRRAYRRAGGKFSLCAVCWGNRVQIQSEVCS
ncbi:MAG: radical SAM protein [Proteobacteria bacterium]|nr:radical SAM protein [Pseudomonadota bacterium]MBU1593918.1 radical SAM protein [Pseudomonadota bacterium]